MWQVFFPPECLTKIQLIFYQSIFFMFVVKTKKNTCERFKQHWKTETDISYITKHIGQVLLKIGNRGIT